MAADVSTSIKELWKFVFFIYTRVKKNQSQKNAAALTFTSLFAVVPFMTLSYALLSAIPELSGVGERLQNFIFSNFVPAAGEVVQDYLKQFSSQAKNLSIFGVVFLLVTALLMLRAIEDAFNKIWQVPQGRKGVNSFLLYWSVLTLGPLLMGVGIILSSALASLPLWNENWGQKHFLQWLPFVLSAGAFALIYMLVPNTRVPWKHAFFGGVVVALVFEAAKKGFAAYVSAFPSYQLIYGAFAAVPLFLLWIYLSWFILLIGAEIIHGLGIYKRNWAPLQDRPVLTLLGLLQGLYQAHEVGKGVELNTLQNRLNYVMDEDVDRAVTWLLDNQIIVRLSTGELMISRDVSSYTLMDLLSDYPWPIPGPEQLMNIEEDGVWFSRFKALLIEHQKQQLKLLDVSLKDFYRDNQVK